MKEKESMLSGIDGVVTAKELVKMQSILANWQTKGYSILNKKKEDEDA